MTTDQSAPPVFRSAIDGWRDAFTAFARMPVTFSVAVLAALALNALTIPSTLRELEPPFEPSFYVITFADGLMKGFLLTPVAIAVHRHVLLGEITGRYRISPTNSRFLRFFLFTIVFQFLTLIPIMLMGVVTMVSGWVAFVLGLFAFFAFIIAVIFALRLLILFPAIAVDAPATAWRNALLDTEGHSWRVLFIVLVAGIPSLLLYAPLKQLLQLQIGSSAAGMAILVIVRSVYPVLTIAVYAAIASRLYLAFSDRLGRPFGIASAS